MNATADQSFDSKDFRRALSLFPTGVAIITTRDFSGRPVGLTCSSFNSVSLDPPLVTWSLRKESKSADAFRSTGAFAISILTGDQQSLSARFASSSVADKFEDVKVEEGLNGVPLLPHCAASFECSTYAIHDAGDHYLFIGTVERYRHEPSHHPLVFCKGAYMLLSHALLDAADLSAERAAEVIEARRLIHSAVVRLACSRATESDFEALQEKLEEMDRCTECGEKQRRVAAGVEFFRLIGKATHNQVVGTLADAMAELMRRDSGSSEPRADLVPVRRDILQSLRLRDSESAEAHLTRYLGLLAQPRETAVADLAH